VRPEGLFRGQIYLLRKVFFLLYLFFNLNIGI
jgi:hypothetical protein